MLKVCKFGGTSLANSAQFNKVKDIIVADKTRKFIVVSAPGKRSSSDYKITDLLYLTYSHIKYKVDYTTIFDQVKQRYYEIAKELNLSLDLSAEFDKLEEKMKSGISEEELVSRGEYFSALLMANYLNYHFVDAKDLICFNYDGKINEEKTLNAVREIAQKYHHIVVPGFYGAYPNGAICLFSRGGSDVTASYLAKGIDAALYENFTDVSGILMTDPKIVANPRKIKEVTYAELRELSYLGASVLHEETILPLIDVNIPLAILNTNAPEEEGTLIKQATDDKTYLLTGITGKKDFYAFTIVKTKLSDKIKVMLDVLNIFKKYNVNVEHIPTSIDSFSVVVSKASVLEKIYEIIAELKGIEDVVDVSLDEDIALVAVVGRNMVMTTGTSGRILSVFGKEEINIKLIAQGREETNIIVGISNADFNKSIKALYDNFAYEKIK